MSFPKLFDQLGFPHPPSNSNLSPGTSVAAPPREPSPHQSTPAIVNPLHEFDHAYGGQQPIEIDSTATTPAATNHQNDIEIIPISSDSDENTRGGRNTHSVEPAGTPYSLPELTALMSGHRPPAQGTQPEAAPPAAPVAPGLPGRPGGTQVGNYSQPYPTQTQQDLAGYQYHPNYPGHLASPVYTYPAQQTTYQAQQPQPHHQPYPSTSNQVLPPPPPPLSQPPTTDEEARLKDAVLQAKRDVLEMHSRDPTPSQTLFDTWIHVQCFPHLPTD